MLRTVAWLYSSAEIAADSEPQPKSHRPAQLAAKPHVEPNPPSPGNQQDKSIVYLRCNQQGSITASMTLNKQLLYTLHGPPAPDNTE